MGISFPPVTPTDPSTHTWPPIHPHTLSRSLTHMAFELLGREFGGDWLGCNAKCPTRATLAGAHQGKDRDCKHTLARPQPAHRPAHGARTLLLRPCDERKCVS